MKITKAVILCRNKQEIDVVLKVLQKMFDVTPADDFEYVNDGYIQVYPEVGGLYARMHEEGPFAGKVIFSYHNLHGLLTSLCQPKVEVQVGKYKGVIEDGKVKIECQSFSFDAVKNLQQAIQRYTSQALPLSISKIQIHAETIEQKRAAFAFFQAFGGGLISTRDKGAVDKFNAEWANWTYFYIETQRGYITASVHPLRNFLVFEYKDLDKALLAILREKDPIEVEICPGYKAKVEGALVFVYNNINKEKPPFLVASFPASEIDTLAAAIEKAQLL